MSSTSLQITTYLEQQDDLVTIKECGVTEVLLSHQSLSRLGKLSDSKLCELATEALSLGIRTVLEWDVLMREQSFSRSVEVLERLDLSLFKAIRIQDPGALEYVLQKIPNVPIQLVLESGNHNFEGIKRWCDYVGDRLERIVLSVELPAKRLQEYTCKLNVPVEVLGLGPILLFYTPRYLLSHQKDSFDWLKDERDFSPHRLSAIASCEDDMHRGFRIHENSHGTFLFHAKDYCLFDRVLETRETGIAYLRVDLRLEAQFEQLYHVAGLLKKPSEEESEAFKAQYPRKVTRCFFQANATDVLFKKLKNKETQRQDENFIGKVIELNREEGYTIIEISTALTGAIQELRVGMNLKMITTTGALIQRTIASLKNLEGESVQAIGKGDFAVIPYVKFALNGTAVYLEYG